MDSGEKIEEILTVDETTVLDSPFTEEQVALLIEKNVKPPN